MGFICLALLSFIFFRIVVILFTSVGGAAMLVMGAVALLLHSESIAPSVHDQLLLHPGVLPMVVLAAAVVGFVYQQGGSSDGASEEE